MSFGQRPRWPAREWRLPKRRPTQAGMHWTCFHPDCRQHKVMTGTATDATAIANHLATHRQETR